MFAVIRTGGKQYKVAKDDVILVERLDAEKGASISLDEVLMVGDDAAQTVGAPLVDGASVAATVLDQARGDKIIVFKKKRRKTYRRTKGHRQDLTVLQINEILTEGRKPAAKAKAKTDKPAAAETAPEATSEEAPAKKPAAKRAAAKKKPAAETDKE